VPTQINPEPPVASEPSLAARSVSPQDSLHPTISVDSVKTAPPDQDSETAHTQDALSISSGEARRPLSYRSQTFPVQRPNSRRTPSFTRMFSSSQSNTTRRFTKLGQSFVRGGPTNHLVPPIFEFNLTPDSWSETSSLLGAPASRPYASSISP
jgi:hypothetical protein